MLEQIRAGRGWQQWCRHRLSLVSRDMGVRGTVGAGETVWEVHSPPPPPAALVSSGPLGHSRHAAGRASPHPQHFLRPRSSMGCTEVALSASACLQTGPGRFLAPGTTCRSRHTTWPGQLLSPCAPCTIRLGQLHGGRSQPGPIAHGSSLRCQEPG